MKTLALLIAMLCVGDLALDRGEMLRSVGSGAVQFSHNFAAAFHDSLFAA